MIDRLRSWARPIGWIIGIAVFVAIARSLAVDSARVWETLLRVDPVMLVVGMLLLAAAHLLGAAEWWLLLRGLGSRLPMRQAVLIHCTATMVKYLPGFGWQIAGKIELAGRRGVPRKLAAASIAIEFAAIIGGGALIAVVLAPFGKDERAAALPVGLVAVIGLLGIVAALAVLRRASIRSVIGLEGSFRPDFVILSTAAMTATWTIVGSGTFAIAGSVQSLAAGDWPVVMTATTIGFIGGLLAVFAPTGIGVREGLIVLGLSPILDESAAVAVAVLLRISLMLSELVIYLLVLVVMPHEGHVSAADQNSNASAPKRYGGRY